MKEIKIFVTHSPNCYTMRVRNSMLYDVIAGSDFMLQDVPQGCLTDNTGDNISSKNKSYCELTTQYWAWKNQDADYFGFCHYRRFFNFSPESLRENSWGTVEYDYLDSRAMEELHFNEADMRSCIERYDFLIAKGVDASCMNAENIYEQYRNAPELHIRDVELVLEIIEERYPYLSGTAKQFFDGKTFYPCNMFIMTRDIFQEYSALLFGILSEFERRADISDYSREGYRTIGHLGERIAGIYYLYLKAQGRFCLGELQVALIHHTEAEAGPVKYAEGTVPIVLAANQKYVPILCTCIQSITDQAAAEGRYHIFVLHTDIGKESRDRIVRKLSSDNMEISFLDVGSRVSGYALEAKEHITTETFYRFLILDIFKEYHKVIYLDCDMIVCCDIADLYHTEMGDDMVAAVADADFAGQCNKKDSDMRQYCQDVLDMEDPFGYFQAGVLLMNIQEMRKQMTVPELLRMADTGIYRFSDQDILNIVCKGRVHYLDMAWNLITDCDHFRWQQVIKHAPYYVLDAYEGARRKPRIIHYAGFRKPWMKPDEDFAEEFWRVARRTDYYEILLWNMMEYGLTSSDIVQKKEPEDGIFLGTARRIMRHFFPKGSRGRDWAIGMYFKLKRNRGQGSSGK